MIIHLDGVDDDDHKKDAVHTAYHNIINTFEKKVMEGNYTTIHVGTEWAETIFWWEQTGWKSVYNSLIQQQQVRGATW